MKLEQKFIIANRIIIGILIILIIIGVHMCNKKDGEKDKFIPHMKHVGKSNKDTLDSIIPIVTLDKP